MKKILFLLLVSLTLSACSGDNESDGSNNYINQPVQGEIDLDAAKSF